MKRQNNIFESVFCQNGMYSNDSTKDFCQIWLSNNLINADSKAEKFDNLYDKSDSDSLCSFDSLQSHCSVMLNDEEHICIDDEISFDLSDTNSPISNMIDELNWLQNDTEFNDLEVGFDIIISISIR